jgi:RNA polymerase sigma factor (sigma-70 family)
MPADADGELDQRSLSDLYQTEWTPMVRLAWLILGSRHAAEDAVQDAFIRVAKAWDHVHTPVPYLRTAVVNSARDRARQSHRERSYTEGRVDAELPPDENAMWEAVQKLRQKQREAIVLRFYSDLSYRDIADHLDCTSSTARSLVRRALIALREDYPWA